MASSDNHLPDDLRGELERHEAKRSDVAGARRALENALTHQIREVANGMMADAVIRNQKLSGLAWWQQFLSREDEPARYAVALNLPEFLAYRSQFAQKIASGQIRPIAPKDVLERQIRIYGGFCEFGDEGRINHQLSRLGSSFRLVVVGSRRSRVAKAKALLLGGESTVSFDGRFLFGSTEPMSVWLGAAMFVFRREWALSPYMEPNALGFTDGPRIVVRVTPIRADVEVDCAERQVVINAKDEIPDSQRDFWFDDQGNLASEEWMIRDQMRRVIRHEGSHILYAGDQISFSNSVILTQRGIHREDVLRYAIVPRTVDEFRTVFCEDRPEVESRSGFMTHAEFDEIFTSLCEHGLLISNNVGQYESKTFRKGVSWDP